MMSAVSPCYAAIDLGSNSFHMLVVREVAGTIQTIARIKRKVRLAAGLDQDNRLSAEAIERGCQCLALFAERLQDIPLQHVRVVATAALRSACNAAEFLAPAERILGHPIEIIAGEEEARLIYQGVAHTTGGPEQRLVVDIGGASTELIVGAGVQPQQLVSLHMGCVTWLERFFADRRLCAHNFAAAETAARDVLAPIAEQYRAARWQICVGASGTVQALQEIMQAQGMDEHITLPKLYQLREQAIQCYKLEELEIDGLTLDRALVFPSGLSILIAIFETLSIREMTLSGGALREGLIYGMLGCVGEGDVRARTMRALQQRYQIDTEQALRVRNTAWQLFDQVADDWHLSLLSRELLGYVALVHEIGLGIDYKRAHEHAAYLLANSDVPGFTPAQRKLLAALLFNQREQPDLTRLAGQNALSVSDALKLCRLLRLAIILASRRRDDTLPQVRLQVSGEQLCLYLPAGWLHQHPLRAEDLRQESRWMNNLHLPLLLPEDTHFSSGTCSH